MCNVLEMSLLFRAAVIVLLATILHMLQMLESSAPHVSYVIVLKFEILCYSGQAGWCHHKHTVGGPIPCEIDT